MAVKTIVEKIAQAHLAEGPKRPLRTGDFCSIRPHHVMTHDNTSAVMKKFKTIGAKKVHDPAQLVFALDHDIQNTDEANLASTAASRPSRKSTASISIRRVRASATRSWWSGDTFCRDRLSSRPIRTPTCMARWARWARRSCAPTRPRSGRPANSGGRFRASIQVVLEGKLPRGRHRQRRHHHALRALQPR